MRSEWLFELGSVSIWKKGYISLKVTKIRKPRNYNDNVML